MSVICPYLGVLHHTGRCSVGLEKICDPMSKGYDVFIEHIAKTNHLADCLQKKTDHKRFVIVNH